MAQQSPLVSRTSRQRKSQDALDSRIAFIPRGHKLLLAAISVVIASAAVWGAIGSIQTKVAGNGITVRSGQMVFPIQGETSGRIAKINATIGQEIRVDQVIVEISHPDIEEKIVLGRKALQELKSDLARMEKRYDDDLKAHERATVEKLASISTNIANTMNQRDRLEKLVSDYEKLFKDGYAKRIDVIKYESDYEETLTKITGLESQVADAKAELVDFRAGIADRLQEALRRVQNQERSLEEIEVRLESGRYVRAQVTGIVEEIRVSIGEMVRPDDVMITVATGGKGFEVLAFLRPEDGRRVEKDMDVHVIPTTVKKAEFGTMRGKVVFVSEAPVSSAQINALLRDPELSKSFTKNWVPYMSRIELFATSKNPSGFEWWSGEGPPYPVTIGTLANIEIVVREQAPVTLVVPAVREALGF